MKILKTFLEAYPISQNELAKELEVDKAAISRWLRGLQTPSKLMMAHIERTLPKIARKLNKVLTAATARSTM